MIERIVTAKDFTMNRETSKANFPEKKQCCRGAIVGWPPRRPPQQQHPMPPLPPFHNTTTTTGLGRRGPGSKTKSPGALDRQGGGGRMGGGIHRRCLWDQFPPCTLVLFLQGPSRLITTGRRLFGDQFRLVLVLDCVFAALQRTDRCIGLGCILSPRHSHFDPTFCRHVLGSDSSHMAGLGILGPLHPGPGGLGPFVCHPLCALAFLNQPTK